MYLNIVSFSINDSYSVPKSSNLIINLDLEKEKSTLLFFKKRLLNECNIAELEKTIKNEFEQPYFNKLTQSLKQNINKTSVTHQEVKSLQLLIIALLIIPRWSY